MNVLRVCMVHHVCACTFVQALSEEALAPLELELQMDSCEQPYGCWELNPAKVTSALHG